MQRVVANNRQPMRRTSGRFIDEKSTRESIGRCYVKIVGHKTTTFWQVVRAGRRDWRCLDKRQESSESKPNVSVDAIAQAIELAIRGGF